MLPVFVLGQEKYKFKYRQFLTRVESTYSATTTDTLLESNKSVLSFQILDKQGETVPFQHITIKNNEVEKSFLTDLNDFFTITMTSGTFSISIYGQIYTPITIDNFNLKESKKVNIKISLGRANEMKIALISSVRKLTDEEIEKIIDDLSNGREDNQLIKNKTCFIGWEL